jgi:hypothetical protein
MTAATEKYPVIDKWTLRTHVVDIEVTDEEEAIISAKAAEFGITVEEYIRMMVGCQP